MLFLVVSLPQTGPVPAKRRVHLFNSGFSFQPVAATLSHRLQLTIIKAILRLPSFLGGSHFCFSYVLLSTLVTPTHPPIALVLIYSRVGSMLGLADSEY